MIMVIQALVYSDACFCLEFMALHMAYLQIGDSHSSAYEQVVRLYGRRADSPHYYRLGNSTEINLIFSKRILEKDTTIGM